MHTCKQMAPAISFVMVGGKPSVRFEAGQLCASEHSTRVQEASRFRLKQVQMQWTQLLPYVCGL